MRTFFRAVGILMLFLAAVLLALTAVAWPPGGLMFALPYFFLIPGVVLALLGALLLFLTRPRRPPERAEGDGV
jgi:vacuolar-type H+-ATPase subunit I/STV1